MTGLRDRFNDVVNVINRIGYAGILSHALVGEIYFTVFVDSNVFKQSIAFYGIIDIGLGLFTEVDDLCIAASLEIENPVVVPAMLIITDKLTLGIGGKSSLTRTGETEEDCCITIFTNVGRAMH